jgi:nicotinamidase/pyrazinamidase
LVTRALHYLDALEAQGRYTLMVWPVHCAVGSWGHNVHPAVLAAAQNWAERSLRPLRFVPKGMNPWTEHYSALQAEVPDAEDPETQLNRGLLRSLERADLILIAGEASSHCVRATTEHLVQHLPGGGAQRLVLLTDCMSPVRGFEAQAQAFLADMQAQGVRLASSVQMREELGWKDEA